LTAYIVAAVDVEDARAYTAYRERVPAILAAYGGRYLARGGTQTVLEGTWPGGRTVVMAFADRASAEAFYMSEAYRQILPIRQGTSTGALVIVDGVEPA
jgi:uncharacterized protein (DUF1330 family)